MKKKEPKSKKIKKTYKKIFKDIFYFLKSDSKLIDYGLDWLRLKTDKISINLEKLSKQNSTLWDNFYLDVNWDSYLVVVWRSSVWKTFNFVLSYNYKWFYKPLNLFRVLYDDLNHSILIDVYWITFQIYREYNFDIDGFLGSILDFSSFISISRVDYNFNFHLDNITIDDYIEKIYNQYNYWNRVNYNNDSISYWLYIKKWRRQNKVVYRLTTRFWFRLYNKIQNVFDLGIAGLYKQYQWLNILRLEGVLWSESCKWLDYWDLDYVSSQVKEKIIWNVRIIPSNNNICKNKTNIQLDKMEKDIDSRLTTFIFNWWDFKSLKTLQNYIENIDSQDYQDYWF